MLVLPARFIDKVLAIKKTGQMTGFLLNSKLNLVYVFFTLVAQ